MTTGLGRAWLGSLDAQLEISTDDGRTRQPHGDPRPCDAGPITWDINFPDATIADPALACVIMTVRGQGDRLEPAPFDPGYVRRVVDGDVVTAVPTIASPAT